MDETDVSEGIRKAKRFQTIKTRPTLENGNVREIVEVSLGPSFDLIKDWYREFFKSFDEEDMMIQRGAMDGDVQGHIMYNKTGIENCEHEDRYFFSEMDGIWEGCRNCGREVIYSK